MTDPKKITDKPPYPEHSTEQLEWLKKYLQLTEVENIFDANKTLNIDEALAFISRIEKVMENLATIINTKKEANKNDKTKKVNSTIKEIDKNYRLRENLNTITTRILETDEKLQYLKNHITPIINKIDIRCGENCNSSESEKIAKSQENHQPSHNHGRHYGQL